MNCLEVAVNHVLNEIGHAALEEVYIDDQDPIKKNPDMIYRSRAKIGGMNPGCICHPNYPCCYCCTKQYNGEFEACHETL